MNQIMDTTMSTPIRLIAFDLDGTLLDSVPDLAIAADQAVRAMGYAGVSEAQVREYVGNGADILIARALSQSLTIDPQLPAELLTKARVLFDEFYEQTQHQKSRLYPQVIETLTHLKQAGFILALVTNKPSRFVPEVLATHQLTDYFSEVLGGDRFAQKKPDPMALNWLLEQYQLSAQQMLMVGDSKNDILAAKNAGCASFALTYGYNHGEPIALANPDYLADNINVLLSVLGLTQSL